MKRWIKRIAYLLLFFFIFLNIISAFHAYKLTHFFDAKVEVKKRPEDMSGWEKTSTILFGINHNKSTIKATPAVQYTTFNITTSDGLKLEGWNIPASNSKGTVIMFHGHGGNRSGVVTEANEFNKLGYNVCMIDFRAHGNSLGNTCTIGFDETADVLAAYNHVRSKGENKVILWGISLGSATILKALHDHPEIKVQKAILEMPFGSLYEAVKGRLRIMHLPEQPFAALLTFWGGTQQGFWAFSHNPQEYAKAVKIPVLLQWGRHDARVTGQETNKILRNIATSKKQLIVYEESGHESLLKIEPEKWRAAVATFLNQ